MRIRRTHDLKNKIKMYNNKLIIIFILGTEKERDYMREHGKKKEGFRNVLPPQIFNGEKYCGVSVIIFIKILCK